MPNGVMTGDGSRSNPLIVMDALDFNALRNVDAPDAANVKFIELGANINLSGFGTFVPIPTKAFNIDGKGFIISDFSIVTTGLFENIRPTEYVRNIIVEGEITNGSTTSGLLAGTITTLQPNVVIEDIEGYGSITASSGSTVRYAGLIGNINVGSSGAPTNIIQRCSFRGTATLATAGQIGFFGGVCNLAATSSFGGSAPILHCIQCQSLCQMQRESDCCRFPYRRTGNGISLG